MNNNSQRVIHWLPYLRRYARALSGSQQRGDAYVRACLEVLVEEPGHLSADGDTRLELFKLFHKVWRIVESSGIPTNRDDSALDARLRRNVASLEPRERQVLLLTALEDFSIDEAAEILELPVAEAIDRARSAQQELQARTGARILIIEDDAVVAEDIGRIVDDMGHAVVGVASRERKAVELAQTHAPELVLADIQLRDGGSGLRAVEQIVGNSHTPVIFVTAYPERMLAQSAVEPTLVISKPFDPDSLKLAIGHALALSEHGSRPMA